ncbi:MAG TPA: HEAT repeat domain-containing protein, partial [Methanoregulaceae archaeon]|nr:HEAT repeat domain-containing protein [Methanoregulaceae archaeon]
MTDYCSRSSGIADVEDMRMKMEISRDIKALADPDRNIRIKAVKRLSDSGQPAVEPLIRAMEREGSKDFRWYAAVTLARIGQPAIEPLITALKGNQDTEFRRYASAALGHMGGEAVDPLLLAMKNADPSLRGFLSAAL